MRNWRHARKSDVTAKTIGMKSNNEQPLKRLNSFGGYITLPYGPPIISLLHFLVHVSLINTKFYRMFLYNHLIDSKNCK